MISASVQEAGRAAVLLRATFSCICAHATEDRARASITQPFGLLSDLALFTTPQWAVAAAGDLVKIQILIQLLWVAPNSLHF